MEIPSKIAIMDSKEVSLGLKVVLSSMIQVLHFNLTAQVREEHSKSLVASSFYINLNSFIIMLLREVLFTRITQDSATLIKLKDRKIMLLFLVELFRVSQLPILK